MFHWAVTGRDLYRKPQPIKVQSYGVQSQWTHLLNNSSTWGTGNMVEEGVQRLTHNFYLRPLVNTFFSMFLKPSVLPVWQIFLHNKNPSKDDKMHRVIQHSVVLGFHLFSKGFAIFNSVFEQWGIDPFNFLRIVTICIFNKCALRRQQPTHLGAAHRLWLCLPLSVLFEHHPFPGPCTGPSCSHQCIFLLMLLANLRVISSSHLFCNSFKSRGFS